jgi:hypothetical protein
MVLTAIVCSSQHAHALLYLISSCHFITIEASMFVASVDSSDVQQQAVIKFYFKWSRIPWKCNNTSKMCTVMLSESSTIACTLSRMQGVAGG